MIENNTLDFFLNFIKEDCKDIDSKEWTITSLGTGNNNYLWYWKIHLKNIKTLDTKIISIPCYKN